MSTSSIISLVITVAIVILLLKVANKVLGYGLIGLVLVVWFILAFIVKPF